MPLIAISACRKIEDYRQSILHAGGQVRLVDPSIPVGIWCNVDTGCDWGIGKFGLFRLDGSPTRLPLLLDHLRRRGLRVARLEFQPASLQAVVSELVPGW